VVGGARLGVLLSGGFPSAREIGGVLVVAVGNFRLAGQERKTAFGRGRGKNFCRWFDGKEALHGQEVGILVHEEHAGLGGRQSDNSAQL
jgi:hypothetical protein